MVNKCWVPHISLVFGEMWDTTNLNVRPFWSPKTPRFSAVVSHISPKTSEMWGTQHLLGIRLLGFRPVVTGNQVAFIADEEQSCTAVLKLTREIFAAAYVSKLDCLLV